MDRVREKKKKNFPPLYPNERGSVIHPIAISQLDTQIANNNSVIQENNESMIRLIDQTSNQQLRRGDSTSLPPISSKNSNVKVRKNIVRFGNRHHSKPAPGKHGSFKSSPSSKVQSPYRRNQSPSDYIPEHESKAKESFALGILQNIRTLACDSTTTFDYQQQLLSQDLSKESLFQNIQPNQTYDMNNSAFKQIEILPPNNSDIFTSNQSSQTNLLHNNNLGISRLGRKNSSFMDHQSVSHLIRNCFNSKKHSVQNTSLPTGRQGQQISEIIDTSSSRIKSLKTNKFGDKIFINIQEHNESEFPAQAYQQIQRFDVHQHFSTKIHNADLQRSMMNTSAQQRGDMFQHYMDGIFNKNDEKKCYADARKIMIEKQKSPSKFSKGKDDSDSVGFQTSLAQGNPYKLVLDPFEMKKRKIFQSNSIKKRKSVMGYYTKPEYLQNLPALLPGDSPAIASRRSMIKN